MNDTRNDTSMNPILTRMRQPGPKKILACDGGGIRGLISVEILARLEAQLRHHFAQPDLLLGDYFDFICGTSTGAIIASCLSCGMDMATIRNFYLDHGVSMFERARWYLQLHNKYEAEPLAGILREAFYNQLQGHPSEQQDGDAVVELGDPRLKGLLMLMLRNHSTDSPWPVCNNPLARYNQPNRKDCNLRLPLWQLVRASTAAPTFFPPEVVTLAPGTNEEYSFVFVDGGMTTYNNPAWMAVQMATASPYEINWRTGADQLLVVSVGTGNAPAARPDLRPEELWLLDHAKSVPLALMNSATAGWDMVCRIVGECRFGGQVDREFGTMMQAPGMPADQGNWSGAKQFAYVRYDPLTNREGLDALGLSQIPEQDLAAMDDVRKIPQLREVGSAFAKRYVLLDHLSGFI
jgi:predicted acylesterase/phospholipase RssA